MDDDTTPAPALTLAEHPIDRALTALSEAVALSLAGRSPSRFAEASRLTTLAHQLQGLRPAAGVADVGLDDDDHEGNAGGPNIMMPNPLPRAYRFNDGADLQREVLMIAQGFLKQYADIEKAKAAKPQTDSRLTEVMELTSLVELRIKIETEQDTKSVPEQIQRRIDHLLQRIGEPTHESEPSAVVPAEPIRGCPPDGAGGQDGDRVGEPLADGA